MTRKGKWKSVTDFDNCHGEENLTGASTANEDKEIRELNGLNDFSSDKLDSCNYFIHEPEELSALYDPRLHFPIISLTCPDNVMMASSTVTQLINDTGVLHSAEEMTPTTTTQDDSSEIKESPITLDDLETDLCQNKYCTDADVLNAVCVFSQRTSPVNNAVDLRKETTTRTSFLETVNNIIQSEVHSDNNSVNSLEYWSDEEGRYPPQMSLSPIPGEAKFRKTTPKPKDAMKYSRIIAEDPKKSDDHPKHHLKRPVIRTLTPITSNHPPYPSYSPKYQTRTTVMETTSQNITPSFLFNSAEHVAKSVRSSQLHNLIRRTPNDFPISSPSLVRATVATPPRTRKNKQYNTSTQIIGLNYSSRMKEDKLFEMQRCSMPKRKVSRSQSSNTSGTSKLFPEIATIAKTQATSRSISDFRQSSSIFGKLVKKNIVKERENDKKKNIDSTKQGKAGLTADQASTSSTSRSKVGETTRRKLRRILSLH